MKKEYSIEIIKLAEKLYLKKSLSRYSKERDNNTIVYNKIINATTFLEHNPVFRERLWYIINDYITRILCKECNINFVKFNSYKFFTYCSNSCVNNSIDIRNKIKQTNIERYGVEVPLQNKEILNKVKQTNIERYGISNTFQLENTRKIVLNNYHNKFLDICNEQYDNQYAYPELKQSHDEISIWCKDHGEFKTLMYYHMAGWSECVGCKSTTTGYSKVAIEWLNHISKSKNIHIQHAENKGEYFISIPDSKIYYFADGYCKETNTIYEFNGDLFHGNPNIYEDNDTPNYFNKNITAKELYQKTIEKENLLKSLGYNVISIWESEWNKIKCKNL